MFAFSVKCVPSLALNALISSAKRVISSPGPNMFTSFVLSTKRVYLQCQKCFRPEPNTLVLEGECDRLQCQKHSFPMQKEHRWVLYQRRMLTNLSIQWQNIFGKKVIPDQRTQLFQHKTTGNKKYFGSGLKAHCWIVHQTCLSTLNNIA